MSDKEQVPTVASVAKNGAEIQLGEKTYKIEKLRAGKFYEAQKVFMALVKSATPTQTKGGQAEVDVDKALTSMFRDWPAMVVKFVTMCINSKEVTEEKILAEAYPEQVTDAFRACLKLNNVFENLKKSAAPIGELGGLPKAE